MLIIVPVLVLGIYLLSILDPSDARPAAVQVAIVVIIAFGVLAWVRIKHKFAAHWSDR